MSTAAAAPCPSMQVVGVRGSGETSTTAGGYGHTVKDVVDQVRRLSPTAAATRIDYPAVPVQLLKPTYSTGNYTKSVRTGVTALTRYIKSFTSSTCAGSTPLFLVGFSQGAQVVGDAYQGLGVLSPETPITAAQRARIAGVVMIADPSFRGGQGSPIDVGTYSASVNGIQDATAAPRSLPAGAPVRSYCTGDDVVCQYQPFNFNIAAERCVVGNTSQCPHLRYRTATLPSSGLTYTRLAANYLVAQWRRSGVTLDDQKSSGAVASPRHVFATRTPRLAGATNAAAAAWTTAVNGVVAAKRAALSDWIALYCTKDPLPACADQSRLDTTWKGRVVGKRYVSVALLSTYHAAVSNVNQNDADTVTLSLSTNRVLPLSAVLDTGSVLAPLRTAMRSQGLAAGGRLPSETTGRCEAESVDRKALGDYTVDRDGVTFWFDRYQAAIGACSQTAVTMSWAAVRPHLTALGQDLRTAATT